MDQLPPGVDPWQIPVIKPPPGVIPNFVDPPSQASVVLGTGISLGIFSLIFVAIRCWTNLVVVKKLHADDYLCILAWCLVTAYFGISAALGRVAHHGYDIPLPAVDASLTKLYFASNFVLGPMCWATRATILTLYIRLFGTKRWMRWTCYGALLFLGLVYFSSPIIAGTLCAPRMGEEWGTPVVLRCTDARHAGPVYGAVGLAADILLLVLPLPLIHRLNLTKGKKMALSGVFLVGIFAIVASIVALYYRIKIYTSIDTFWDAANTYAGVIVEGYVTVFVSCAPAISSFWMNKLSQTHIVTSLRNIITRTQATSKSERLSGEDASYGGYQKSNASSVSHANGKTMDIERHTTIELTSMPR